MNGLSNKSFYILLLCFGTLPFLVNGYVNSIIYSLPLAYWSFEVLSWIVIPFIVFTLAVKHAGLKASDIGISFKIFGKKNIPLFIIACIMFCPIDYYLYKEMYGFFSELFPTKSYFEYESVIPTDPLLKAVVAIYFGISAGIVEELYYRGLMFKIAQFFTNPAVVYIIASPLVFSVVHWEGGIPNLLTTYVFGLISVLAFLWIRNLWPFMIGHIYTDFVWYS